jgi:hypothetical protein
MMIDNRRTVRRMTRTSLLACAIGIGLPTAGAYAATPNGNVSLLGPIPGHPLANGGGPAYGVSDDATVVVLLR